MPPIAELTELIRCAELVVKLPTFKEFPDKHLLRAIFEARMAIATGMAAPTWELKKGLKYYGLEGPIWAALENLRAAIPQSGDCDWWPDYLTDAMNAAGAAFALAAQGESR